MIKNSLISLLLLYFILFLSLLSNIIDAKIYLKEQFLDTDWEKRWIQSKSSDDLGKFVVSAGKFYADELESRGLQTSQDAKKYAISTKLDDLIDNTDKTLVVQFSVKHEQNIDCGGGYIKLLPEDFDPLNFNGDSKYNIMFGPDICGPKRKIHLIFQYKGENKLINKNLPTPYDQLTHLFTLIVKPDHTYKVLVDNKEEASGNLEDDFDFLPPREIDDPDAKKPKDWIDDELIIDPNDTKPEDWKDVPQTIPDPDAQKPDDWDDESDGDWEAPHISNPDYQGEWKPKMIKNPLYKGPWKQPKISNPDYKPDPSLHAYKTLYAGFELWQVKSGTIFDNILITDDVEFASTFANQTFEKFREQEIEAKEKLDSSETIKVSDDPDEEDLDLDSDLTDDTTDSFSDKNGKDDKKLNVQDNQDNQEILRAVPIDDKIQQQQQQNQQQKPSFHEEEKVEKVSEENVKEDEDEFDKLFDILANDDKKPHKDEL